VPEESKRPHWTTFVIPLGSLIVGSVTVWLAWNSYHSTANVNRKTQRPFLSAEIKETLLSFEDQTHGKRVNVEIEIELKNLGKTPAYNVKYTVPVESVLHCKEADTLTANNHSIAPDATLIIKQKCFKALNSSGQSGESHSIYGRIEYSDAFDQAFLEPALYRLEFDLPEVWKKKH
jgi:hypothetical protein